MSEQMDNAKKPEDDYNGCRWFLLSSIALAAIIIWLLCSCCVIQDVRYSIDNWQTEDVQPVYYHESQEVYKPVKMKPIAKRDSIREWSE